MDNYYPQTQSYGRKLDPPRYDLCFVKGRKGALDLEMGPNSRALLPDAVTEKPAAYYTYVVEHN